MNEEFDPFGANKPVVESDGGNPLEQEQRYSKRNIAKALGFAYAQQEKGFLTSEEYQEIAAAEWRLGRNEASNADMELLAKWVDKNQWHKITQEGSAELREELLKKFGPEVVEKADAAGQSVGQMIMHQLLEAQESPEKILALWARLSNSLDARLCTKNNFKPELVRTALELAVALLQVKPTGESEVYVAEALEELKKNYAV